MWVRVCSEPVCKWHSKQFHAPLHSIFTHKFVSRNYFCFSKLFFCVFKIAISRVPMVNESIPMDDDKKKRQEINLNIITKNRKNWNRRRCILYICEPVHLYNFCSRIVTYTLLVFLGKPTRLSAFKIYSRFSWSIKKHFRKEKRRETGNVWRNVRVAEQQVFSVLFFSSRGWKEMREKRYDNMWWTIPAATLWQVRKRKSKKKYAEGGRRLTLGNTHTHTDTQKVEDDGGSLHECDTDGITSADHKEKEEFLYFTHSRNKI